MAEASKEQYIRISLEPDLADKPLAVGAKLDWPLSYIGEQNLRIESVKSVEVGPEPDSYGLFALIYLNTDKKISDAKPDYTDIKQELVDRISEGIKVIKASK